MALVGLLTLLKVEVEPLERVHSLKSLEIEVKGVWSQIGQGQVTQRALEPTFLGPVMDFLGVGCGEN